MNKKTKIIAYVVTVFVIGIVTFAAIINQMNKNSALEMSKTEGMEVLVDIQSGVNGKNVMRMVNSFYIAPSSAGQTDGLELESILSKSADDWSEADKIMVANAYKSAAKSGDTTIFSLIILGCMTAETEFDSKIANIGSYTYNIGFDQEKISNILSVLDNVDDVEYCNMLYRIAKYNRTGVRHMKNEAASSAEKVMGDVKLSCKVDEEGISSLSLKYSSETETIERLDFSNARITNQYFNDMFETEYISFLLDTFVYCESQTDIDILSNLYNRNYYEATSINPDDSDFSDYAKIEFVQFVNSLIYYGDKSDLISEIQLFTDQAIMTDEDRCPEKKNNYGNEYMDMLGEYSQLIIDKEARDIFDNAQLYESADKLDGLQNEMYSNLELSGIWKMISTSISKDYFIGMNLDEYNKGEMTFKTTEFEYIESNQAISLCIIMQDNEGNNIYVKEEPYFAKIDNLFYKYEYVSDKEDTDNDSDWDKQLRHIYVEVIGSDTLSALKIANLNDGIIEKQIAYDTMVDTKANAVKSFYNYFIPAYSYVVNTVAGDDSKTYVADYIPIMKSLGESVYGEIGSEEWLIAADVYNPYTLVQLRKIQEIGLAGVTGDYDEIENIAEKIGYREIDQNHKEYLMNYRNKSSEYIEEFSAEIDLVLFGRNSDTEGINDYGWDILTMPNLGKVISELDDADISYTYLQYIWDNDPDDTTE